MKHIMKNRLREQLDKHNSNLDELAAILNITYQTLSKKMNEHVEFTRYELWTIKRRYDLTAEQMEYIFFSDK